MLSFFINTFEQIGGLACFSSITFTKIAVPFNPELLCYIGGIYRFTLLSS